MLTELVSLINDLEFFVKCQVNIQVYTCNALPDVNNKYIYIQLCITVKEDIMFYVIISLREINILLLCNIFCYHLQNRSTN